MAKYSTLSSLNGMCQELGNDLKNCRGSIDLETGKFRTALAKNLALGDVSKTRGLIDALRSRIQALAHEYGYEEGAWCIRNIATAAALSTVRTTLECTTKLEEQFLPLFRDHWKRMNTTGCFRHRSRKQDQFLKRNIYHFCDALTAAENSEQMQTHGADANDITRNWYNISYRRMHSTSQGLNIDAKYYGTHQEKDAVFRFEDAFHSALLATSNVETCPATLRTLSRLQLIDCLESPERSTKLFQPHRKFAVEGQELRVTASAIDAIVRDGWHMEECKTSQYCRDL